MAKILVFNNDTNRMETYIRGEDEAMPYVTNGTLRVGEFRGSSKSPTLWTEKRAMQAWNSFRYVYGRPIDVGFAFKRPYEGRTFSAKANTMLGLSFDVGQKLTPIERNVMRNAALLIGVPTLSKANMRSIEIFS